MSDKYKIDLQSKLTEKDKELLNKLDKSIKLQEKLADLTIYYKDRQRNEEFYLMQCRPFSDIQCDSVNTLLFKYAYYRPSFHNNTFYFNRALPIAVFMQFKEDSKDFNFDNLVINSTDARWGYIKWKQKRKSNI